MKIALIDIGSNLTHESFASDRDAVLARAAAAGVTRQIVTGTDLASSSQGASLAAAARGVLWSTAGFHPHHAAGFDAAAAAAIAELASRPQVVAVGECGLDYFRDLSPRDAQRRAFAAQLELAARIGKPVFLHQRDAHGDFVAILREHRAHLVGGVAHCFTGGRAELEDYVQLDLRVGVTGWVNDERRGARLREAVPHIPAERLLLETDAPYLLPRDLDPPPKSRRNEPAYLAHIAGAVARLRGESVESLAAAATSNAIRLFGLE
ncbi:MAG TPA: TatD family hydrolase [Steroidobacteraceae bacterium]|nr:TatD family hydrolase [Steroidobacteraceae bacterium]